MHFDKDGHVLRTWGTFGHSKFTTTTHLTWVHTSPEYHLTWPPTSPEYPPHLSTHLTWVHASPEYTPHLSTHLTRVPTSPEFPPHLSTHLIWAPKSSKTIHLIASLLVSPKYLPADILPTSMLAKTGVCWKFYVYFNAHSTIWYLTNYSLMSSCRNSKQIRCSSLIGSRWETKETLCCWQRK